MASLIIPSLGSPADWSLPEKFTAFRDIQCRAVSDILDSPKRVIGASLSVGSGKSLAAIALHRLLPSRRTVVLTATKGLQSQYIDDFRSIGMRDIRGRNSYACSMGVDCETGAAARCQLKDTSLCPYNSDRTSALDAELVVTNYHYWITAHRFGRGLGEFDLLILDEAHSAEDILSSLTAVTIFKPRVHPQPKNYESHAWWRQWAETQLPVPIPDPLEDPQAYRKAKNWEATLKAINTLPDDWVIDEGARQYQFSPLWPGRRASSLLFRDVPKVVLMSGTIRPKTLELLGLGKDEYDFFEYDSPFDPERAPVYWVPTCRVDSRITAEQEVIWLRRIDQIIRSRLDRKGIIHAVSYQRAKYIMSQSEFRHRMVTHSKESGSAVQAVERFKQSDKPLVLVSPSVTTGYDFPDDACRYQIIAKVPFPDNREQRNLAKKRQEEDPEYAMYGVLQQIVQAAGRSTRSEEDWSEVFVLDDHVGWVTGKYKHLMPRGFQVKKVMTIPDGEEFRRRWEK